MKEILDVIENRMAEKNGSQYATFDFDKTCINNDIQEMLYVYQAENCWYDLTPDEFEERIPICEHIPEEYSAMRCCVKNIENEAIRLYTCLFNANCKDETVLKDFAAKMLALLEIANSKCENIFTYRWVLRFLEKKTNEEISAAAGTVLNNNMRIEREVIQYHAPIMQELGMAPSLRRGAKINENTYKIMRFLVEKGVEVYIVSASSCEAVSGAVASCKYSELIPKDRILALEIHCDEMIDYITIDEGKEDTIKKELYPLYHDDPPILAMGDSSGDFWMMKMLGQEGMRVVVGNNAALHRKLQEAALPYYMVEESK